MRIPTITLLLLGIAGAIATASAEVRVDADYPGGNIVVDKIDRDDVFLHQDLGDTKGWWFYWNFRVRGAEGRTLTFHFTNRPAFGSRGPAMSDDEGRTWSWLGNKVVSKATIRHTFSPEATSVRFAFALPYQAADFVRFLAKHRDNKAVAVHELCKTAKDRSLKRLHLGDPEAEPAHRVLLTCRHHACESTASHVLEGLLAAALADTGDGRWFRQNVALMTIPFMDLDGVEEGDQGKNRIPHDHNRDYGAESIYPSVAALRQFVPGWSAGGLDAAIDLHCPWFNETRIYLVGNEDASIRNEQQKFSGILQKTCDPSFGYRPEHNIPFGKGWNTAANYKSGTSFSRWAGTLPGIRMATTIEVPYASSGKSTLTPATARALGADLAKALRRYLEER